MIDPGLFTVERLLTELLDDRSGADNAWRKHVVIERITRTFQTEPPQKLWVVRYGKSYLRHSKGPRQGHCWDAFADDYQSPELALIGLLAAPVPPFLLKDEVWSKP